MDNYPEWQQTKLYIEHIKRLRTIRNKSLPYNPVKRSKSKQSTKFKNLYKSAQKSSYLTPKKLSIRTLQKRYQTQPASKKLEALRSPIPLVSQDEGRLIKSTLNAHNITLKQKQRLLQNYLLSRRILETKSVIDPSKIKKSFRLHQKTLHNMSRSKSKGQLSQQRSINFRRYQKQKQESNQIQAGEGRNIFQFKIKQVLLIKGLIVKNPEVLYNLKIYIGKNHYQFRALSYNTLFNKKITIYFKKSLLINNPQISILLSVLRQNHEQQIGVFKPIIKNFQIKQSQIYKVMKGKFPVGTIDIQGKVNYFINQSSSPKKHSLQQKLKTLQP